MSNDPSDLVAHIQRLQAELAAAQELLRATIPVSLELGLSAGRVTDDSADVRIRAQQQLAAIFAHSPFAISLTREEDGAYVDVNQEWIRLTGQTLKDVLGQTTVSMGWWTDAQQRKKVMSLLEQHGRVNNIDLPLLRHDGGKLTIQASLSRIEMGGTAYLLTYARDVSSERKAQAELLASEQLLKASNHRLNQQIRLFESMEALASVAYWTCGDEPGSLRWSNGLYHLLGLPLGSIRDVVQAKALVAPEDLERYEAAWAQASGTIVECRMQHPDGRMRWHRSRIQRWSGLGDDGLVFGVVQDITKEREAALALQDKLDFIEKITRGAPGMVFRLRQIKVNHYQFLYVSERARDIYRTFTPAQFLADAGCTLKLHHPDDLGDLLRSITHCAQTLTPWSHEYRLLFEDGEIRWLLGQAMPERDADGVVLWNGFITDVTARKLAEDRLRASEARFRALTELSSDWYWEQDADFRFVRVDGKIQFEDVLLGKRRWDCGASSVSAAQWAQHIALLQAHLPFYNFEIQRTSKGGGLMWVSVSGAPMFDAHGAFIGYRGIGRDVSVRRADESKIERLAFYDSLTGLPNRRLLIDRLQNAMVMCERAQQTGALLFIDLDNFKDLNDTQGHDKGDQLLKQVALRLSECVRDADTVARLGGDEFVVMLQKLSMDTNEAATHAEAVGRKILNALNQPYQLGSNQHHSTPSIGIALFQDSLLSIDDLLKRADLAMYQAKAAGRNTARFFDPEMQAAASARAKVEADLRLALQRKEFVLYYQQVVDQNNFVIGVEALVRWNHPERGLVAPAGFIQVAEHTGLILPLGQWVLEAACAQLVEWSRRRETERLSIAVNVSARQFKHPEFTRQILQLLRASGANPYRLKLELTESLLLNDFDDVVAKMSELRSIGVGFSLDDFGTGYSSLSYLKLLPLDQLKIDQSFVRDVLTDPNDAAIARAILTLATSLNLGVVAEGVESTGQRDFLLNSGCTTFQGYLFGKPVLPDQLPLK